MTTYRIGTPAATILELRITFDGTITPRLRQRRLDGELVDLTPSHFQPAAQVTHAAFVVRVEHSHHGVLELVPPGSAFVYARTIMPLGRARPFLDSELPVSAGSNGAFSIAEEVTFRLADHCLSWESENMSGKAVLNELYPELALLLRLPPGQRGSVTFDPPLFARTDGAPESCIAA
jgi:hypothetical protein